MTSQHDFTEFMQELEAYREADPLLFLRAVALSQSLATPDLRFLRAEVLHALATRLHAGLQLCGFSNEIVIRPQGVFIDVGGVLMESSRAGIYWKASGAALKNQGEALSNVLKRMNINVTTAVDIGANFGEISLWLAREYPQARVIAVEPSTDNLGTLEINKSAQDFATGNVEIARQAVTDKVGTVTVTRGAGAMNRIVSSDQSDGTEIVKCDRLDSLFDSLRIDTADFVKIDIEGAEPQLKEAMIALGHRIRSYYIEFSQFAPLNAYLTLASALLSQGFVCYDENCSAILASSDDISQYLRKQFAPGPQTVTNLWFFAPSVKAG